MSAVAADAVNHLRIARYSVSPVRYYAGPLSAQSADNTTQYTPVG